VSAVILRRKVIPSNARDPWSAALGVLLAVTVLFALAVPVDAHDIPATVLVRAFIKPDGNTLRVIIRAPLAAMRDINFPMRDSARYLDIPRAEPLLHEAATTWITNAIQLYEGDSLLTGQIAATRISLPSDRSFASYDSAVGHFHGPPLRATIDLPWQQAVIDVEIVYPIRSARSTFSIDPALARLAVRTTTVLRFLPEGGTERAFEYIGDPGLVRLDPHWYQAAGRFVRLGFDHILDGIDHLLFIFCLVIPFRRIRPLIIVVTGFTVAHSITLIASTLGLAPTGLWFPPLIEVLIAASIVYMALENILLAASPESSGVRLDHRWMVAFGFGLVHGFGFSFALRESLQFAGAHLATSLVSFNVGVELGQILVLLIAIPILNLLFKRIDERVGTIILSALVAHTAWHWLTDRWGVFRRYHLPPAAATLVTYAAVLVGLAVLILTFWEPHGRAILAALQKRNSPREPEAE
jgi:hypothetical protein